MKLSYVLFFFTINATAFADGSLNVATLGRGSQITCVRDDKIFKQQNIEFPEQFEVSAVGTKYLVKQLVGPNTLTIYSCDHIEIIKPNS